MSQIFQNVVLGHWDGWQPFSSTFCGCGAIEVSIASMSKVHCCHTDEIYVVGFVPSYLIPKKRDAGGVIYKECLYQLPIITIILVSDSKADFLMKRSL